MKMHGTTVKIMFRMLFMYFKYAQTAQTYQLKRCYDVHT